MLGRRCLAVESLQSYSGDRLLRCCSVDAGLKFGERLRMGGLCVSKYRTSARLSCPGELAAATAAAAVAPNSESWCMGGGNGEAVALSETSAVVGNPATATGAWGLG
jgi:hypothetical protein